MNRMLSIFYTMVCVLSPILVIYSLVGGSFTILDLSIILFYIISLHSYFSFKRQKVVPPYFILFVFLIIHSICYYIYNSDGSMFLRAMHLANYIFFIAFYNKHYFNEDLAHKALRVVAGISTLFLIVQHAAYMFLGISIPGIWEAFAIQEADIENTVYGTDIIRFASFFIEPASYVAYIVCALTHELFYQDKKYFSFVFFLCFGIILSTSNTGLACMALLVCIYMYENRLFSRKSLLVVTALIAIFFIAQPFVDIFYVRISGGSSYANRFDGYEIVEDLLVHPLWGEGFISPKDIEFYLSGFARLLVYLGIIGVSTYLIVFLKVFSQTAKKELFLVFVFLNIGSNSLLGVGFLFFSCFFFSHRIFVSNGINFNNNNKFQRLRRA